MANELSYRVCGQCSVNHKNPITGVFTNTYFKCKLCQMPKKDGCYMLFTHDAQEHYVAKPVMFVGDRGTGKTKWLLDKINENESVAGSRFYVLVGHGSNAAAHLIKELGFKLGFTKDQHYKIFVPQRFDVVRSFEGINASESNVYVDEVQMLDRHTVTELSTMVAAGHIRQLFVTKQLTPLDILTNNSHIYTPEDFS